MLRTLANFIFTGGYDSSSNKFAQSPSMMSDGSANMLILGNGRTRVFKGVASRVGEVGSRVMMNAGDDYCGLGAHGDSTGIGSIFRVLGAFFFIGAGSFLRNGTDTGADASTTLQLKKVASGTLGTTYQAGSAQPSAPTVQAVTAPSGYTGKNNGVASVRISRIRAATGAESNASLSSNVVQCTNQSVAVVFPSADANGQDYWGIYVTKNGEGAVGNSFFLQEVPESVIAASTTSVTLLDADTTIRVPNSTLTSAHIGWAYRAYQTESLTAVVPANITTAGNAKCVVTAAGMAGSPVTVTFAVALNDTAAQVATKARTALAANATVGAFFNIGGESSQIIITAKTAAANDATMNFTLEDVTSAGITDDTTSDAIIAAADTLTYITTVGASDSGGAGYQQITLAAASGITGNAVGTFTRAVAGVTRSYVFEWKDADIAGSDLAPIRNYPPPAGIFGGASGDVVFVDGCLGDTVDVTRYARDNGISSANTTTSTVGNAIAVSDPAKPESFPPDNFLFTGDAPTAVLQGGNGIHWRFAQNSLGVIRYVGGSPAVTYERIWTGIGVQKQHNACLGAGGRLYAYTGKRGAVRLGANGEPDTSFAASVALDMEGWTASNVVLGYDANFGYVLYMHGRSLLAFHEPTETWCSPLTVSTNMVGSTNIMGAVTVNGGVILSYGSGSIINLYNFDSYSEPMTGIAVSAWVPSEGVSDTISRLHVAMRANAASTATIKVFANGSATESSSQTITTSNAFFHGMTLRPNVRAAKSFRVSASYSLEADADAGFESIRVEGVTNGVTF